MAVAQRTEYLSFVGSVKSKNVIDGRTQGYICDTEKKPVIGRMQALSSTDGDIFDSINLAFYFSYGWIIFG